MAKPETQAGPPQGGGPVNRGEILRAVQLYQIARMRVTHAELLRSSVHGPLCEFFLRDLYGPHEAGASRAAALHSLAEVLRRLLPGWIYDGATSLIELHALSERLDDRLARMLVSLGASRGFSAAEFEAAYFACDDYADRARQIALSAASTTFGLALSRHRSVDRLLGAAHGLRGLPRIAPLLAMLERGQRAFRGAGDIGPVIADMRAGETAYLDGIYAKLRR